MPRHKASGIFFRGDLFYREGAKSAKKTLKPERAVLQAFTHE
jgi:hypothetical protein